MATQKSIAILLTGEEEHAIDASTNELARYFHGNLNFSPLFKIENLLDPQKMRSELLTPFLGNGQQFTVTTQDSDATTHKTVNNLQVNNLQINCTFFDRKSDTLLVVGTGFANEREKIAPFIHMFDKYDIVIFDYRGHGQEQPKLLDDSHWGIKPSEIIKNILNKLKPLLDWNKIPNLGVNKTTFGLTEENDLLAVINHVKQNKNYLRTFGIGFCFSSHIFAKAAASNPDLFDKLILDSSMHSTQKTIDRVIESPQLIFDPQRGRWESLRKEENSEQFDSFTKQAWFVETVTHFIKRAFAKIHIPNKTTGDYLKQLDIPILFFHGKKDIMSPYKEDFINNWKSTGSKEKMAVLFETTTHLTSHIKHKELYKLAGDLFFELDYNQFISCIKDRQKLIHYKVQKITGDLQSLKSGELYG